MLMWISRALATLIYSVSYVYIYAYLSTNIKSKKFTLYNCGVITIFFVFDVFLNIYGGPELKLIVRFVGLIIFFKVLYKEKFRKIIITILVMYIAFSVSEMLSGYLINRLNISFNYILNNPLAYLVFNIVTLVNALLIIRFKYIINMFKKLISDNNDDPKYKNNILFIIISMFLIAYLIYLNYNYVIINSYSLITYAFFIGIIVLIFIYYKDKIKINKILWQYQQLLSYVKDYEKLLKTKSKAQHEYINQLVVIRDMGIKNKRLYNYITKFLEQNEKSENEDLLNQLINVPSGGLKGLMHYKLSKMLAKNIVVNIEIDKVFNYDKINFFVQEKLEEITKVLGIYLDNAMEATLNSTQKIISISLKKEDQKIIFCIANTFLGRIDFNKIEKEGYSSKGEWRGYGLSIVKTILKRYKSIKEYKVINGHFYEQYVEIKLK